ncbi:hypothetical protein CVT26_001940 [Gymnopilus dilepis]|uniref:DUF6699 domain-containing protein n=1 Tax=Gymnopilus dilepis TaxID=231916 RepID=A0A409VRU2_9AGAR|nr:hypothetical protein CVT26_001940 [Gymnopilus dilepis]
MPGKHVKHVHFDESLDAPSPTFSSSTLPSTPGPLTPPPLGFGSPYHTTPLPDDKNAVPNPVLAVSKRPLIEYDLSQHPSTVIPLMTNVPPKLWEQQATQPPFASIDIYCAQLPWKLTIHAKADFVTVADVLEGLYRLLRTNVTPAEFNLLPSREAQQKVTAAFIYRCKQIPDQVLSDAEMKKGVKRIDFLCSHTRFKGLVHGQGGWTLMVS